MVSVEHRELTVQPCSVTDITTDQPPYRRSLEGHRIIHSVSLHGRVGEWIVLGKPELLFRLLDRVFEIRELRFPVVTLIMEQARE